MIFIAGLLVLINGFFVGAEFALANSGLVLKGMDVIQAFGKHRN